jgi:translocation protein SEC72
MALSRPPWEPAGLGKEEASIALCNRSAAFGSAGAWSNALADAAAVVTLRRNWPKGHYRYQIIFNLMVRKARALVELGRLKEARQAIVDGLQFEPDDKVQSDEHLLMSRN